MYKWRLFNNQLQSSVVQGIVKFATDICEGITASNKQLHVEKPTVSLGAYITDM